MKRTNQEQSLIDFTTKKSVHISISRSAHANFRISCFKHQLSMQEVFEEFVQRVANESPEAVAILEDISMRKLNKEIRKYDNDTDMLFNIIALENPIKDV